jgi:hypothetical protein
MQYYELNEDKITLSKPSTIYAIYSGHIFLFAAFITCFLKHYYLSLLCFCVYVSTMFFWSSISDEYNPTLKAIDILLASSIIGLVTFYYCQYYFKDTYKKIWYFVVIIVLSVYLLNYKLYEYSVGSHMSFSKIFNIESRELINHISVLCHCVFVHILPVFAYIYCAFYSL